MSDISANARKLFNALPVGTKVSGGKIKDRVQLSDLDYKAAKKELKQANLVELGKGRGGTIIRLEDAELPDEPATKSPEEILEIAREVKQEKSRAQKQLDKTKAAVLEAGHRLYPDADKLVLGLSSDEWYVEVWKDHAAKVHFVPEHEWSNDE